MEDIKENKKTKRPRKIFIIVAIIAIAVIIAGIVILAVYLSKRVNYDGSSEFELREGCSDFYYGNLSEEQKKMYRMLYKEAENILYNGQNKSSLGVYRYADYELTEYQAVEAWYAFRYDAPEFFFISNSYVALPDSIEVTISSEFLSRQAREKVLRSISDSVEQVKQLLNGIDDVACKFKIIYDYVMDNTDYKRGENGEDVFDGYSYSIAGPLDGDESTNSICQGYASSISYLCNVFGIECIYVGSGYKNHALNIVKIGNTWYYADATYDDTDNEGYSYFLHGHDSDWSNVIKSSEDQYKNRLLGFLPRLHFGNFDCVFSDGTLRYKILNRTTCTVVDCEEGVREAVIPSDYGRMDVTAIDDNSFKLRSALLSLTIPKSIKSIGVSAFLGCNNLAIYLEVEEHSMRWNNEFIPTVWGCKENGITDSGLKWGLTSDDKIVITGYCGKSTSVNIPSTINGRAVSSVCAYSFKRRSDLVAIEIPDTVTSVGASAFSYCDILTVYCETKIKPSGWDESWNVSNCPVVWDCKNNTTADDGNIYYVAADGIRYSLQDGEAILTAQSRLIDGAIVIPGEIIFNSLPYRVTRITDKAFDNCWNLTKIVIPSTVISVGREAFAQCTFLTVFCQAKSQPVDWSEDWNIRNYPVVWDCDNNVVADDGNIYYLADDGIRYMIKDGVASVIGQSNSISGDIVILDKITIGGATYSVRSIADYAFIGCSGITSVVIPSGVTYVGRDAFNRCDSLTNVILPSGLISIGEWAFGECGALIEIIIPSSVTSIDSFAFIYCDNLTIYCERENQPEEWDEDWNYGNCPVKWNYKKT